MIRMCCFWIVILGHCVWEGGEGCKTCRLFLCGPNTSLTPHSLSSMMHRATETMRKGLKSFIAAIQGSRRILQFRRLTYLCIALNNIHMWDVQAYYVQWRRSFWAGETEPAIVQRKKGRVEEGPRLQSYLTFQPWFTRLTFIPSPCPSNQNIARIANAVQVTICQLVCTSVY